MISNGFGASNGDGIDSLAANEDGLEIGIGFGTWEMCLMRDVGPTEEIWVPSCANGPVVYREHGVLMAAPDCEELTVLADREFTVYTLPSGAEHLVSEPLDDGFATLMRSPGQCTLLAWDQQGRWDPTELPLEACAGRPTMSVDAREGVVWIAAGPVWAVDDDGPRLFLDDVGDLVTFDPSTRVVVLARRDGSTVAALQPDDASLRWSSSVGAPITHLHTLGPMGGVVAKVKSEDSDAGGLLILAAANGALRASEQDADHGIHVTYGLDVSDNGNEIGLLNDGDELVRFQVIAY